MSKSSEEGVAGNGSAQETVNGSQKDTNGNIYENRAGTKKIIRVVTVMAYVFSVSFAAILLSAYYVFLWEPPNPRLQRHPLSGDPQVDFLMDSLLSNKNLNNYNESDDHTNVTHDPEEYENPIKKFNNILFERIMTNDQEPIINYPQKLIAFKDFAKFYHRTNSYGEEDSDQTTISETEEDSSRNTLTTLSIFFKALREIPTEYEVNDKIVEKKKLSDSMKIGGNIEPFKEPWKSIESDEIDENEKRIDSKNLNRSSNAGPEIVNNKTTLGSSIKSNNLTVMSTRDLSVSIYPGIDNRSYPEAIGATTVENNKVTIATESTIEVSTSRLPGLQDDNFEVSLRNQDSKLSENSLEEEISTKKSEVQIYPGELNARDILDDRK